MCYVDDLEKGDFGVAWEVELPGLGARDGFGSC